MKCSAVRVMPVPLALGAVTGVATDLLERCAGMAGQEIPQLGVLGNRGDLGPEVGDLLPATSGGRRCR
jgi:hypothetical protein